MYFKHGIIQFKELKERVRNEIVAVDTSSVEVCIERDEETKRRVLVLKNTSTGTQVITVSLGVVAVANTGIVLNVGEILTDSVSEGYIPFQGKISAISSAAAGQLSVMER